MPSFWKWTVTAMYALWFGDVQAAVAKLRAPLYSLYVPLFLCPTCIESIHIHAKLSQSAVSTLWRFPWHHAKPFELKVCNSLVNPTSVSTETHGHQQLWKGACSFCNPTNNFDASRKTQQINGASNGNAHRNSSLVCCRCENVTLTTPTLSNAAVIDLCLSIGFTSTARAAYTSLTVPAAATVSSPQQAFVCCLRLLVEVVSAVFR